MDASGTIRTLLVAAICFGFLPTVMGCGGNDEGKAREEVSRVLTNATEATYAGDEKKACSLYTPAYVREALRENRALKLTTGTCAELVQALQRVRRQLTPEPTPWVTDVRVAGDRATARMEIRTHLGPAAAKLFLTREDGKWRIYHDQDVRAAPPSPGS